MHATVDQHAVSTGKEHGSAGLIEVGWLLAGPLEELDRQAVLRARDETLSWLEQHLPQFRWQMPIIERPELYHGSQVEPTLLLDEALTERNYKRWDFTLVMTAAELVSYEKKDAVAALSRTLEGAVLSTARIDPRAWQSEASEQQRLQTITRRIRGLALHMLGHWMGLEHHADESNYMHYSDAIGGLDAATDFDARQLGSLAYELAQIADHRLEEQEDAQRSTALMFYLRAVWINRGDLLRAVRKARPWQFPYRLSRLTTPAISALLILLMTAEVWDLGMQQPPARVSLLSLLMIVGMSAFVIRRQRLLVHRGAGALSEQVVLTNVSTSAIVLIGMATTYLLLYAATMFLSWLLFSERLAADWAASLGVPVGLRHYLTLSGFIAQLGIAIGALGASFEEQNYFRHVTYVDEEW